MFKTIILIINFILFLINSIMFISTKDNYFGVWMILNLIIIFSILNDNK